MMPLMVAPSLVGLMYRLVLHEFVGPVPYYAYHALRLEPVLPERQARCSGRWSRWSALQWTPFAFLLFHMAYRRHPGRAARGGGDGRRAAAGAPAPHRAAADGCRRSSSRFFVRFIDGFRVFDNVYTLVGSGPGGSTASLSIYIYEAFFRQGAIGRAVAASVLLFAALLRCCSGRSTASPAAEAGLMLRRSALVGLRLRRAPHQPAGDRDAGHLVQEPAARSPATRASGSRRRRSRTTPRCWSRRDRLNLFGYLGNSLAISLIGSGLALLLALPAAHAIARGELRAPDAAAAGRQPAGGAADHLRDPDLHGLPVARASRHPRSASD